MESRTNEPRRTESSAAAPMLSPVNSLGIAEEAAVALYRKKGENIRLFRVDDTTVIADYYVIAVGRSVTHMRALADEAIYRLHQKGISSYRTEGLEGNEWLLIDFGSVLVHIFSHEAREYYNLERLLNPSGEIGVQELFEEADRTIKEEGDTEE